MIIDYVTATFESDEVLAECIQRLDRGAMSTGGAGVITGWILLGTGRGRSARGDRPARLSLGGKALGVWRESGGTVDGLFGRIAALEGRITRVDYAWDWEGTSPGALVGLMCEAIREGWYQSRWKLARSGSSLRSHAVVGRGETLRIGSTSSDNQWRVYDKAAEQGLDDVVWVRLELQTRRSQAAGIAEQMLAAGDADAFVRSVVLGLLEFKDEGADTNKSRWAPAGWWSDLWGSVSYSLGLGSELGSVDDTLGWIESIAPTLAMAADFVGGDGYLEDLLRSGRERYRDSAAHLGRLKSWERDRAEALKDAKFAPARPVGAPDQEG